VGTAPSSVPPFIAVQIRGGILVAKVGATLGVRGAIAVDPGMRTNLPDVSSPGTASRGELPVPDVPSRDRGAAGDRCEWDRPASAVGPGTGLGQPQVRLGLSKVTVMTPLPL
jgi:hypothetical protein